METLESVEFASHLRFAVATTGKLEFVDLTDRLATIVAVAGLRCGIVNVQSLHATAAVVVNENEPLLLERARCRTLSLPASASLNVVRGTLQLGCKQRVFLLELDGPQEREVSVSMIGEGCR